MNNFNCTCCGTIFNSNTGLKRHRKMKLQHTLHKYKQYVKDMNKKNNICDCLCCRACFPPTNENQNQIDWHNCQLKIIISAELDQIYGNNRPKEKDVHMEILSMLEYFNDPVIADNFINHVNNINFDYKGMSDGSHIYFNLED